LIVAAVLSLVLAAAGAILAWRNWPTGSALSEPGAMRRYGIIVGVEFGVAALGAAVIGLAGNATYLAPWICLVVGVHFAPMAPVLKNPALIALGVLLVVVAVAAVLMARRTDLAASALTGAGAGLLLFGFAAGSAIATVKTVVVVPNA
jgi:hypothetical protein